MRKTLGILLTLTVLLALALPGAAMAQVDPDFVQQEMAPGDTITVTKTVTTPEIPPLPDIYFLADTTGSMGPAIANVQANASAILADILAADATAQFGVGDYKDFPYDAYAFQSTAPIDGDAAALAAIGGWAAGGGGDGPEGWLYALYKLATDPAIGWRDGSSKVVVIFGDAPAHDPVPAAATGLVFDLNEANVTQALVNAGIRVIAVSLATADFYPAGLDDDPTAFGGDYAAFYGTVEDGTSGQASRIAGATGGAYLFAASPEDVADTILEGLTNLPTDVWPTVVADPGLSVTFEPEVHYGVVSGSTVQFEETITIDAGAPPDIFHAEVTFWANAYPEEGAEIGRESIVVGDFTAPTVSSIEWYNPAGKVIPPAGSTTLPGPKGGMNEDGFYLLEAEDNYSDYPLIYVTYEGSSDPPFGPFYSGTTVKFTEAPGALPMMKKMGSTTGKAGAVYWHIILPADAVVFSVDYAGNVSDPDIQYVPPLPK